MPESKEGDARAPLDLVSGERLMWKMADVKGIFKRRLVTGYLITNYRCFVWDAVTDTVRASLPVGKCDVEVLNVRQGLRSRRGGRFIRWVQTGSGVAGIAAPLEEGSRTTIGDLLFKADGETIMMFRDVDDPEGVKRLVEEMKTLGEEAPEGAAGQVVRGRGAKGPAAV